MTSKWKTVRLGDLATQYMAPFSVVADEEYVNLGVKWYAEGVFARESKLGATIKGSRLFRVKPQQFIYNRMFATEGSFALVPGELASGVVSNEFPVFDLDKSAIVPEYLAFYFQQRNVWEFVAQECVGTTKSRSRWKEERFLAHQISLPPLPEQRRIVDLIGALDAAIEAADQAIVSALGTLKSLQSSVPQGERTTLGNLLKGIDSGVSVKQGDTPSESINVGILKVSAVRSARFQPQEIKRLGALKMPEKARVNEGDLLITRSNTPTTVGQVCIARDVPENAFMPDLIWRLNLDNSSVNTEFLEHFLSNAKSRSAITSMASGTSLSMRKINKAGIQKLPIDLPPMAAQIRYAELCNAGRISLVFIKEKSASLRKLRGEMLSSLLSGDHAIPETYDDVMPVAEELVTA